MTPTPLRALMVDPSLFTGPYDAALTEGLLAAGTTPTWAVRPTRAGDRQEIPPEHVAAIFYRRVDQLSGIPARMRSVAKGLAHLWGLLRLLGRALRERPDVVHFQWLVVPPLDGLAILALRRRATVVVTVHDTVPFNGDRLSWLQTGGLGLALRSCDALIVHTREARDRLVARGFSAERIAVIPHGPLQLHEPLPAPPARPEPAVRQFTMFGELKPYKGIDVLVQAVARLAPEARARARFVVAGRPRMDLAPLCRQISALGLDDVVELRPWRLSESEMADLFAATDCFLFPYRQIDASGVYYLTKALGKWMIASRVGIFAEELSGGDRGTLVTPDAPDELADAISQVIAAPPRAPAYTPTNEWRAIGASTVQVYRRALELRGSPRRGPASAAVHAEPAAGSAAVAE